ncbi:olfactory receptor 6N1-like [Heteronotia binoei]|uniref:olfactory receptor 6N1-like n=1 Tax=Heteronotia binoei TaxID=13085 RepID=UPI002930D0ED|nr:olfactory receptor 6N1-like [Heteronotia binoei]
MTYFNQTVATQIQDYRLHTPMDFFIVNLSSLDIGFTTVSVPKMLVNIATEKRTISISGCFIQQYLFYFLGSAECFLLASMSYDRYLAICNPLHYTTLMNQEMCSQLVFGSWLGGFLAPVLPSSFLFQMPFCGSNVINHFFCDAPPLLKLSCKDIFEAEIVNFIVGSLVFVLVTYFFIVTTILRIPSSEGRRKAFSTCALHLTIVIIFFGSTIFMYIHIKTISVFNFNKVVSVWRGRQLGYAAELDLEVEMDMREAPGREPVDPGAGRAVVETTPAVAIAVTPSGVAVHPEDFDLLGFSFEGKYYMDRALPMGCSVSCASFERFSSFVEWALRIKSGLNNTVHYLDDYLFVGPAGSGQCNRLLRSFEDLAGELGVPLAHEKTEGLSLVITFLGIELDTIWQASQLPADKVEGLRDH